MRPVRVCLVAPARHPVREPFCGGLEAFVHQLAGSLAERGHEVTVLAPAGLDPALGVEQHHTPPLRVSRRAWDDVHAPSQQWMREHHAYLAFMLDLGGASRGRYDVVHDHSLHHLPVAMAATVDVPVVTTLHTPPLPWLESALSLDRRRVRVTAVSEHVRASWSEVVDAHVVRNGVDADRWPAGPGGPGAVWSGRLVREKAPHLAIDACRAAGVPLVLAGPTSDPEYAAAEVWPRLGPDVRHLGHLGQAALAEVVGRSAVCVVSPAWDEPFGLVAAEALACGTPVAAFDRGGLREVVGDAGRLARPDDVADLARAVREAARLPRARARERAVSSLSWLRTVEGYEDLYRAVSVSAVA